MKPDDKLLERGCMVTYGTQTMMLWKSTAAILC